MNLLSPTPLFLGAKGLDILNLLDFILLPFLVWGLVALFSAIKKSRYKNSVVAQYFIPALVVRLIGAFLTACLYQYYYGYGDTTWYYFGTLDIANAFFTKGFSTGMEMLLYPYEMYSEEAKSNITIFLFFRNPSMLAVVKTGALFGFLTFGSFIGSSFGITCIAFIGSWMLYRVLQDIYPHLHRELAIAILFVPSVCFWGTGLMKDPLSMGGVGMFVYGLYFLFYKPGARGLALPLIALIIGLYYSIVVKAYIAVAVVPAAIIWLSLMYKNKIKNKTLQALSIPLLLAMGIGFGGIALQQVSSTFKLEDIALEAAKTQWWIALNSELDGGMGYSLGVMEPTVSGMLKKAPAAINVALFRPYPWEARKIIVIPSAVESMFTLFFTFFVFFKIGFFKTFVEMAKDPTVLFCLIFAVIFAFAVGFSSMNFGALARYKIPALPFYFSALVILLDTKGREARIAAFAISQGINAPGITKLPAGTLPLQ
jgi:hypothetical protein